MKAFYHQIGGSVTLEVIGKPAAGKADLGKEKQVLVAGVTISKTGEAGTCTLIEDEDPKAALKAAAKAAFTAKGKDGHESLVKVASEASEASEAAKAADTEADSAEEAAK